MTKPPEPVVTGELKVTHPIENLREMVAMDIKRTSPAESWMIRSGLLADLLDELARHRTAHALPGDVGMLHAALTTARDYVEGNHDEGCELDLEYGEQNFDDEDGARAWPDDLKCTCGTDEILANIDAALTPSALSGDAGDVETTGCNYCGSQVMLMGSEYLDRFAEALDAAGAPRKSPDGLVHLSFVDRIAALPAHKGAGE